MRRLLIVFFLVFFITGRAVPQTWDIVLKNASAAVVNVQSRMCGGSNDRNATGFVWRDQSTVVTALHVVAGCQNLSVSYENTERNTVISRSVHIAKILARSDLALLTVDNPPQVLPLVIDSSDRPVGTNLEVLGFPLQQPRMLSTKLSIRFGSSVLGDLLGPLASQFSKNSSPAVDLKITNIEGHLLPGLSGAPILDSRGHVVAIGDGGLSSGTIGISWAIPANDVNDLASSSSSLVTASSRSHPALFAAESEARVRGRATCGKFQLTWIRSTSLREVAATNDDIMGLQKIINQLGVNPDDVSFDVYQHLGSGATVALPSGTTLSSGPEGCSARSAGGQFVTRIQIAAVSSDTMQPTSQEMERNDMGTLDGWQTDPGFTYPVPLTRAADSLLVRRKGFVHLNPQLLTANSIPQDKYLFAVVAFRGTTLVNTSIMNTIATVDFNKSDLLCHLQPSGAGCDQILAASKLWAASVLGVHLTTFSIG